MRIYTRLTYQWRDNGYVLVDEDGFDYSGPVDLCKGASAAQDSLAASQTSFYNQMVSDTNSQFANQQAIQSSLNKALEPIVAAGPNQFGFSNAQVQNMNSTATTGVATSYANAKKGLQNSQAAQGGGNAYLPSGVQQQQNEELASSGANQQANELLGIQNAGYAQGAQTFQSAIGQLQNVDNSLNATGFAGASNTAGTAADAETNKIEEENAAASPMSAIGGILGAGATAGLDAFTGGVGGTAAKDVMCPARGSLYLMADGSEKVVEELKVGEQLAGIDGEPETIEEIETADGPVLRTETEDGFVGRTSRVHAFALPAGGFVISTKALGKKIRTAKGASLVIKSVLDGKDTVYNVITDGSHTYRADGIWALGAGEGERHVSMAAWARIEAQMYGKEE